jgi:energy-coupling factor transport system permease protein
MVRFGQYIPGDTRVHTLDARMKLLLVAAFVSALFLSDGWIGIALCAGALCACYLAAHIALSRALRGIKPILLILAFTFFANALTFSAGADALPEGLHLLGLELSVPQSVPLVGSFGVVPLGVLRGLYFVVRIVLLVSVTTLLTYTTSVVALTDAISSLLAPLRLARVPVDDIAMMFAIALRFIPVTATEAEKVMTAQAARGARFDQGGPVRRVKAYLPVMVPLFVNLFKRADALAAAMESRCYEGAGRTRLSTSRVTASDVCVGLVGAAALIVCGALL